MHVGIVNPRCVGENVPSIPGACATRNFTYLVRGPFPTAHMEGTCMLISAGTTSYQGRWSQQPSWEHRTANPVIYWYNYYWEHEEEEEEEEEEGKKTWCRLLAHILRFKLSWYFCIIKLNIYRLWWAHVDACQWHVEYNSCKNTSSEISGYACLI